MKKLSFVLALLASASLISCGQKTPEVSSSVSSSSQIQGYPITVINVTGISISVSTPAAEEGATVVIDGVLNKGYLLDSYTVDGNDIVGSSFVMPGHAVTVSARVSEDLRPHAINAIYNNYVNFTIDKAAAAKGETVTIDYYMPTYSYVVDHFEVDGAPIEGTSFVMPAYDVDVKAVEKNIFAETYASVKVEPREGFNFSAESRWYARYADEGVYLHVVVEDKFVIDDKTLVPDMGMRDNIEFTICHVDDVKGLVAGESFNVLVSSDGSGRARYASGKETWGSYIKVDKEFFSYSAKKLSYLNKDGIEGWQADIFLANETIYRDGPDDFDFCIGLAMRNTVTPVYKSEFAVHEDMIWNNVSTFALLNEDGSITRRNGQ